MELQKWLGSGSINVFGMPFSGKDTQGKLLAKHVDGVFLSSGQIVRNMEQKTGQTWTAEGNLAPTQLFYKWVLPYFEKREFWDKPLVLSSIGRWAGEEDQVMNVALAAGHPIKAAIYLQVSEEELKKRWQAAQDVNDRGERADDTNLEIFQKRVHEFNTKTLPVLRHYRDLGLFYLVNGEGTREEVFQRIVKTLSNPKN